MIIDDSDLVAKTDREFIGIVSPTAPRIMAGFASCGARVDPASLPALSLI